MWPQNEYSLTEVEEECQAQALSAQSPSKGLTYHPFLLSRPLPLLQDASIPVPEAMLEVAQLS